MSSKLLDVSEQPPYSGAPSGAPTFLHDQHGRCVTLTECRDTFQTRGILGASHLSGAPVDELVWPLKDHKAESFRRGVNCQDSFITPSMAAILSGARKYRLGLTLAHQDLRQLERRERDVLGAVMANPHTRICFRVGDPDAKKLEDGFMFFEAKDLQNLGLGEAICRVERAEYDFNLRTLPLPAVDLALAKQRRECIVARSRETYARPKEEVEAALRREPRVAVPPLVVHKKPQLKREVKARKRPSAVPTEVEEKPRAPAPLGRGGQQHKYLQQLIKRWADSRRYRVTIEKQILDGLGSVDVALERGEHSVACEISVTSSAEQELGNIQKCLAAGFEYVVVVSSETRMLKKTRKLVTSALDDDNLAQVRFFTPEELFVFLEERDAEGAATEETIHGYKVKVQYRPVGEQEKTTRKQAISQVILKALKRLKGKND